MSVTRPESIPCLLLELESTLIQSRLINLVKWIAIEIGSLEMVQAAQKAIRKHRDAEHFKYGPLPKSFPGFLKIFVYPTPTIHTPSLFPKQRELCDLHRENNVRSVDDLVKVIPSLKEVEPGSTIYKVTVVQPVEKKRKLKK